MKMKIETLGKMTIFDGYKMNIFLRFSYQFNVLILTLLSLLRGVARFLRSSPFYMEPMWHQDPMGDPWGHPKPISCLSSILMQVEELTPNPFSVLITHVPFRRNVLLNEVRKGKNENENRNSWENEDF